MRFRESIAILGLATAAAAAPAQSAAPLKFDFGGKAAPGYTSVSPTTSYTKDRGFGFEPGERVVRVGHDGGDPLRDGCCTGDRPFYFSVAVPEGNYRVTVTLGDA